MENNLLHKDKVWNRIKKYVYFVVFLIILLVTIAIITLILNCIIYNHLKSSMNQLYTST
jgi:hypothetical protein